MNRRKHGREEVKERGKHGSRKGGEGSKGERERER